MFFWCTIAWQLFLLLLEAPTFADPRFLDVTSRNDYITKFMGLSLSFQIQSSEREKCIRQRTRNDHGTPALMSIFVCIRKPVSEPVQGTISVCPYVIVAMFSTSVFQNLSRSVTYCSSAWTRTVTLRKGLYVNSRRKHTLTSKLLKNRTSETIERKKRQMICAVLVSLYTFSRLMLPAWF